MDNGIYISLSRQLALFRDMETTANNLANINTTGFNANHLLFTSYLAKDGQRGSIQFTQDISTWRDTAPGALQVTGNPLDVALGGEGYFMVETPLGRRYTRAGNFQTDGDGTLVTPEGYPVLDQSAQRIAFNDDDREVTIGSAGNISVNGEDRATLAVVTFANPQELQRRGERMYETDQIPVPAENPRVAQGALENANVQPVLELTHMMNVSRAVASTAKYVEVMYDLQQRSVRSWTQAGQ